MNLAVQWGARRILLVGFDMNLKRGAHWHGRHPAGLNNPRQANVDMWRRVLDDQAPILHNLGVEVLNCSMSSDLTAYRKVPFLEAVQYERVVSEQ